MNSKDIDAQIRSRIDTFLKEIGDLVRQSAVQAVQDALGGGPRRSVGAAPQAPAAVRPATAGKRGPKKGSRRASSMDRAEVRTKILDALRSNPQGLRMEELARVTGLDSSHLKVPAKEMAENREVRKDGQRRATTYYPN